MSPSESSMEYDRGDSEYPDELASKYCDRLDKGEPWDTVVESVGRDLGQDMTSRTTVLPKILGHEAERRLGEGAPWDEVHKWVQNQGTLFSPGTAIRWLQEPRPKTWMTPDIQFIKPVGEKGGFGEVWWAKRVTNDIATDVAVKLLNAEAEAPDPESQERFKREIRVLSSLRDQSQYICRYEGCGDWRGRRYLLMEWIDGKTITKACQEHTCTPRARAELFVKVLKGVKTAHAFQIAHRDLKPANILVKSSDGELSPRIVDFGIAALIGVPENLKHGGQITQPNSKPPCTPEYASPEQVMGGKTGFPSDVFSLGVLFHELLYGFRPLQWFERADRSFCWELNRPISDEESNLEHDTRLLKLSSAPSAALRGRNRLSAEDRGRLARNRGISVEQYDLLLRDTRLWQVLQQSLRVEPQKRWSLDELLGQLEVHLRKGTFDLRGESPFKRAMNTRVANAIPVRRPRQQTERRRTDRATESNGKKNGDMPSKGGTSLARLIEAADQGDVDAQYERGMTYYFGEQGVDVDRVEAAIWYTEAAKQNHIAAQFALACMYDEGDGVQVNKAKALEWYTEAAKRGNAGAQCNLGVMYSEGDGVPVDKAKAAELFTEAAKQGDAVAQFNLGEMYLKGDGVQVDKAKALELLIEAADQGDEDAQHTLDEIEGKARELAQYATAADQGDADAQCRLGRMYSEGDGVQVDKAKAMELYTQAVQQRHAGAQFFLGCMYSEGDGVQIDKAKALELYNEAAKRGNPGAQCVLGEMCLKGDGVPVDKAKAAELFTEAANQGYAVAQCKLGTMYCWGDGVPVDRAKAIELFTEAADQGNAHGQFKLGTMYCWGCGVPVDMTKALHLYTEAAKRGDADAQCELGTMYWRGDGVPVDKAKAVELYTEAANQGNADAQHKLNAMYDSAKAVKLYTEAAEQGDAEAQYQLGIAYHWGWGGQVQIDMAKAVEWYTKAADQGNTDALSNLLLMYEIGVGVPVDKAKALELLIKAADQGVGFAQLRLGRMYSEGDGVPVDKAKALELLIKAADQGVDVGFLIRLRWLLKKIVSMLLKSTKKKPSRRM